MGFAMLDAILPPVPREQIMDALETRLSARPRHVSPEEWAVRVDLAACYRLIAHFGWDDLVLTHNSARVPGTTDPVLVLRNHGLLATGRNVAEAFSLTYHFERSAEAQLKIQAAVAGGAKMVIPGPETCERQAAQFAGNMPRLQGQREWPALLRLCDRLDPTYRT